uniref:B box-type domain-containing protein n=1 Tax=Soboliphyme baturini TaxID=241478 RepID=A0A183J7L8_9BILA
LEPTWSQIISGGENGHENRRNFIRCISCHEVLISPVQLPCHHVCCISCARKNRDASNVTSCSECNEAFRLSDEEIQEDSLIKFFIDSLSEKSEVCANCDQVCDCMVFCETCQQALCMECKQATHHAKMFQCHKLTVQEERINGGTVRKCGKHGEPLILFRSDTKSLACISCFLQVKAESRIHFLDLDEAYCRTLKKLSKLLEVIVK